MMIGKDVIIREYNPDIKNSMYFSGTIVDTVGDDKYLVEIISGISYDWRFKIFPKKNLVEIFKKKDLFDEEEYTILNLYNDKYADKNIEFLKLKEEFKVKSEIRMDRIRMDRIRMDRIRMDRIRRM